jgi:microcystin degradation protein MlrC
MVTEIDTDGDGFILQAAREVVGPDVPIVATLDLHANISQRMVDVADVLVGYDTYPHVDMAERAEEACGILARLMHSEISPVAALRKPPMLPTSQRMTTDRMPMRTLIDRAHRMEEDSRVINVTIAGGFPPGDNQDAGFGIVVTTDNDPELAGQLADELAALAWSLRDGFLGAFPTSSTRQNLLLQWSSQATWTWKWGGRWCWSISPTTPGPAAPATVRSWCDSSFTTWCGTRRSLW